MSFVNRIKGQTALITGASAGIGEACARALAAMDVNLILLARRKDRLDSLAQELRRSHGVDVMTRELDVRDREAVRSLAAELDVDGPFPHILVNNAGLVRGRDPVQEGSLEEWDEVIDTNVKGVLAFTRLFLPGMIARNRGHVLNLGSIAGDWVYPGGNVYNATKFAVKALTEATNLDVLGTPIRISSVDPGLVETEFSVVRFRGDEDQAAKVYEGLTPLTGHDVAEAMCWMLNAPPHMNVFRVVLLPTHQRNAYLVQREDP
ncbi:MAG: SDR family NAD(P)-dependent oxidoreductase [Gemmatimonadota bacterium]